jgi:rhodanese-related sulfurtransferase
LFAKPYGQVHAVKAAELVEGGAVLVDVREPHEWEAGHAPQARHIPLAQLPHRARELPENKPLVIVCRSGNRSARAAAVLVQRGREASNLVGGMHAWSRAGLPVVAKGGGPGRVA